MAKRLSIFLLIGNILILPILFGGLVPYLISFVVVNGAIIFCYFVARWQFKRMTKINNEFEMAMMKEGKKVTKLTPEESWNLIKHGVAVTENGSPIILKETHLWQSKNQ